jgi:hypothetical protein
MLEDVIIVKQARGAKETLRSIYEKSTVNPTITLWDCEPGYVLEFLGELSALMHRYPYCACWLNIKAEEADLGRAKRYQSERLRISFILGERSSRKERRRIRMQGFPVAVHFSLSRRNMGRVKGFVKASGENVLLEISQSLPYDDFACFIRDILPLPLEKRKRIFFTNDALASCYHLKPNECGAGRSRAVFAAAGVYPCYDAYKFNEQSPGESSPECATCRGAVFCGGCRFMFPFGEERCSIVKLMISHDNHSSYC